MSDAAPEAPAPQAFDASYAEAILIDLSKAQNDGLWSIETAKTDDNPRAGWIMRLPIAVDDAAPAGFSKPYPKGYAEAVAAALAPLKAELKEQVDAAAEALRLTLITPGSGQAMEYQEAYAEAVAVEAAAQANASATFDAAKFPMLAASIGFDIDPQTGKASTDIVGEARSVLAAYEAYQAAGAAIRRARLAGKAAIAAASDAAGAEAALAAIVWPALA